MKGDGSQGFSNKGESAGGHLPVCISCSTKPPQTFHQIEEKQDWLFSFQLLLTISAGSSHIPLLAPGDSDTWGLSHLRAGQKRAEMRHFHVDTKKTLNMFPTVGVFHDNRGFFLTFIDITLCSKSSGNCSQNNCTRQIISISNLFSSALPDEVMWHFLVLIGNTWCWPLKKKEEFKILNLKPT